MILNLVDWGILLAFFFFSLLIGMSVSKRSGQSFSHFFLGGRDNSWWLIGISMVATTFSADTPNLVTDIVRKHGVMGNWIWWAFCLTGMLNVFLYAKLWRRSGVATDLEFYELRYSGRQAAFIRCFRAFYLGVFFNLMVMASVTLAAIKIGSALLGFSPIQTLSVTLTITFLYSALGGLRGVMLTDLFQFIIAMAGSLAAAYFVVTHEKIGNLETLFSHSLVASKTQLWPTISGNGLDIFIAFLIVPLFIQWWSVYYPGAEPGGGGYVAQRMLSAKNENHALAGTLLFNVMHYAVRPWPWIIVALGSLIIYPDLNSLQEAFPLIDQHIINDDLAYPAMLRLLPHGLLGIVVTSLVAAYMSTMSTHLNWGASYIAHDIYKRFLKPTASEREQVFVGRLSTFLLLLSASLLALMFENALQLFQILMQVGAGTGLILILRWYWWRINAWSEIAAMISSFLIACYFQLIHSKLGFTTLPPERQLILGVILTTIVWVLVTFLTHPNDEQTLKKFCSKIKPDGNGWRFIYQQFESDGVEAIKRRRRNILNAILLMAGSSMVVYCVLIGTGFILYGSILNGLALMAAATCLTITLSKGWRNSSGVF